MSTSLSLAIPQSTDASINEEANTTHTNQSHASYLDDMSLYISNKDFFILIQETGKPYVDPKTGLKYSRKPTKIDYDKNNNRLYKSIYSLAATLFDVYKS